MPHRSPVIEYVPFTTRWQRDKPLVHWSTHSAVLPTYRKYLTELALPDPTLATVEHVRALSLRAAGEQEIPMARSTNDDLVARLASGDLTPAQAKKLTLTDPREAEKAAREQARYLLIASETALTSAVMAIHTFSDEKWMAILKPLAAKAIAAKDQVKLDRIHAFAQFLRSTHVAGLAAAMDSNGNDAEPGFYMFARHDLVHFWRVEHADAIQLLTLQTEALADNWWRIAHDLRPGTPYPSIKDFRSSWKAGIYSAREAIDNAFISRDEHEVEFQKILAKA